MNWFTKSTGEKKSHVVSHIILALLVFFLVPARVFANTNMNWLGGLVIVFPFMFVAGLLASKIDPAFYIRAWLAMVAGAVVWPLCLLFRPIAADLAFVLFTFGARPVAAFHVQRRFAKRR